MNIEYECFYPEIFGEMVNVISINVDLRWYDVIDFGWLIENDWRRVFLFYFMWKFTCCNKNECSTIILYYLVFLQKISFTW
jgi:hypothetical protein